MTSVTSPYAAAIEATRRTIESRLQRYRRLVTGIGLVGAALLAAWAITGTPRVFSMLSMLPVAIAVFLAHDARGVAAWRQSILSFWSEGALDINILATTLRQVPHLPPSTLEGLLAELPFGAKVGIDSASRRSWLKLHDEVALAVYQANVWRGAALALFAVGLMLAAAFTSRREVGWIAVTALPLVAGTLWQARRRLQAARRLRARMDEWKV